MECVKSGTVYYKLDGLIYGISLGQKYGTLMGFTDKVIYDKLKIPNVVLFVLFI